MQTATVQVFAYDEPDITDTLDAISDQQAPAWDVTFEAWVTPADGRTLDAVAAHDTFELFESPTGKLSSRNAAHDAVADDVIVVWDADAPPRQNDTLSRLLAPYVVRDGVVATNGRPLAPWTLVGVPVNIGATLEDTLRPHLHGQLSSFTTDAWRACGPFAAVSETDIDSVRPTEEFEFRRCLERRGEVVDTDATVLNDTRRHECRIRSVPGAFGAPQSGYCGRRGSETFNPRRQR